ncbi:MAG TPA: iron ABC transporter permease [Acetobacteraceae bacterium]|nr:iron ABC transporter permease [Acetobacteraceae bacterium]
MDEPAERAATLALTPVLLLLGLAVPAALLAASAAEPDAWHHLLTSPASLRAIRHTLIAGGASALLAELLGGGFALLAGLTDLPGRRTLSFLFLLLMIIPAQVSVIAWIALTGPASPLLAPLGLAPRPGGPLPLYGPGGIIFLMGIEHAPIVFLIASSGLRAIPAVIPEAAAASGASPRQTLRRILLPLALPSFAAGLSGAFAAGIGNFATPTLLGIPGHYIMLTTLIFQLLSGFGPDELGSITILSLLLGLIALLAAAAEQGLAPGAVLAGPRRSTPPFPLGAWRIPAEALCWLVLAILLFLPLASLVATAATRAYGQNFSLATVTLAHFRTVLLAEPATRRAFLNSTLLALLAATLLVLLAALGAHRARGGGRTVRLSLAAAEIPYVLPGSALGIGCILIFLRPIMGFSLYDTFAILLIAYLMRFFALARRPVQAMLGSFDPSLEEMAASLGAPYRTRLVRILLPALAPGLAAGWLLVFLGVFSELTVSALLWSEGNETVGVMIFNLEQAGELSAAASLSVIAVLVTLGLLAAASIAARGRAILPWQS